MPSRRLQLQEAPAAFPGGTPSCEPSPMVHTYSGLWPASISLTIHVVLITLPSPSGSRFYSYCKAGDSGPLLSTLVGRQSGPREGRKTLLGRSSTASPVSRRQGSSTPMLDRRPPAGLVGIPQSFRLLATPTLPASEASESRSASPGCRETSSPICAGASRAVLAPPTGNGVLNQIPAGDGRESSREQAVPGDGAPLHRPVSRRGRETTSPL